MCLGWYAKLDHGMKFTLNPDKISGKEIVTRWYNPKSGEVQDIGKFPKKPREFTPPSSGYGQDWVLIADDAALNYSVPRIK